MNLKELLTQLVSNREAEGGDEKGDLETKSTERALEEIKHRELRKTVKKLQIKQRNLRAELELGKETLADIESELAGLRKGTEEGKKVKELESERNEERETENVKVVDGIYDSAYLAQENDDLLDYL